MWTQAPRHEGARTRDSRNLGTTLWPISVVSELQTKLLSKDELRYFALSSRLNWEHIVRNARKRVDFTRLSLTNYLCHIPFFSLFNLTTDSTRLCHRTPRSWMANWRRLMMYNFLSLLRPPNLNETLKDVLVQCANDILFGLVDNIRWLCRGPRVF